MVTSAVLSVSASALGADLTTNCGARTTDAPGSKFLYPAKTVVSFYDLDQEIAQQAQTEDRGASVIARRALLCREYAEDRNACRLARYDVTIEAATKFHCQLPKPSPLTNPQCERPGCK